MSKPVVELSPIQMAVADAMARKLHGKLRRAGVKDGHGARSSEMTAAVEAGGSAAELALALYFDTDWTGSIGENSYGPDVGRRTQVRSSNKPRPSHRLIVRDRDIQKYGNVPFVLVIQTGNSFEIKGWCMSHEAREIGKRWDGGDKERPEAWFVHETKLHPIETLEDP